MKRFYKTSEAVPAPARAGLFQVVLDGKPIRSPAKADLLIPGEGLAKAIAAEWSAQVERIQPETMPMMTFASTATDRVAPQREAVAAEIAGYGASDLLCYRADSQPELAARQAQAWDPMLAWVEGAFGAALTVTSGLMPVAQPNTALMLLAREVGRHDSFRLAALHTMVSAMGSLVLGLAVLHGRIGPEEAFDLSQLDEEHQADLWGRDEEAAARRSRLLDEVTAASRLLALLPDADAQGA